MPETTQSLLEQALVARQSGQRDLLLAALERASHLARSSDDFLRVGVAAVQSGVYDVARPCLESHFEQSPESLAGHFWMSILLRQTGDAQGALRYARKAVELAPESAEGQNNLGLCLMALAEPAEAVLAFKEATRVKPSDSVSVFNLGTALYQAGHPGQAVEAFRECVKLTPNSAPAWLGLGQSLLTANAFGDAITAAERALKLDSGPAPLLLMANALAELGLSDESRLRLEAAVALQPSDPELTALIGQRLQSLGRFAEANEWLDRSISAQPKQGFAYFAWAFNNRMDAEHRPRLDRMREVLAEGKISERDRSYLAYGIGRMAESLGEFESAMKAYDEANRLIRRIRFGSQPFDSRAFRDNTETLIARYAMPAPSEVPSPVVLVVGMMRSGTTLVEQILSRHPDVGPTGEAPFWADHRSELLAAVDRGDRRHIEGLGSAYVASLRRISPETRLVTDKLPSNAEIVGPLLQAVPGAKVIHMVRDARDTCFSIYATPNRVAIRYAHEKAAIAEAYRQHVRLMAHWQSPQVLEVSYERLVTNPEPEIRRILEFLDLPWREQTMHPEASERSVVTPSQWQVRQPIHTGSIGRWKPFAPWLGEFRDL